MKEAIVNFGGQIPIQSDYALPTNMASLATNVRLASGVVQGIHRLSIVRDTGDPLVVNATRIPYSPSDLWLTFHDLNAVVLPSPIVNDSHQRFYWHVPGQPLRYATLNQLATLPWVETGGMLLGVPQPTLTPTVTATGGTGLDVSRVYTYTYVSAYGEEGPPATPSDLVTGKDDGTWTVSGMDTVVPDAAQRNITLKRVYRTVFSASGNANFYFVAEIPIASASYVDTKTDLEIASVGRELESLTWFPPPANMAGITGFPNGVFLGWKDATVHMSVPYRPWAWPPVYDVSVGDLIVGIGIFGNTAVVATQGAPSAITMNTPDVSSLSKIGAPEPCLNRGSIVSAPEGVYYASQNGLMLFSGQGFQNVTKPLITKEEWQSRYNPYQLRAARYQTQFIGLTEPGMGYIMDLADGRQGFIELAELSGAHNIMNDMPTGEVFLFANGIIYKWDDPLTDEVIWRWASKRFFTSQEVNFAAVRCSARPGSLASLGTPPPNAPMGANHDPPVGSGGAMNAPPATPPAWAAFLLRVYVQGSLWAERYFTGNHTVKLPDGLKSQDWQFEVIGNVPMVKLEFAETGRELAQV